MDPLEQDATLNFDEAVGKIKKLFFPINVGNNQHWILIEMDIAKERWNVYDSLSTDTLKSYQDIVDVNFNMSKFCRYQVLIQTSYQKLASFVAVEEGFHRTSSCQSWNIQCVPVVRQPNNCDCGVFVCHFLKHLAQGREIPSWRDKDIELFRKVMAWETLDRRVRI